jgi:hypothetical protein
MCLMATARRILLAWTHAGVRNRLIRGSQRETVRSAGVLEQLKVVDGWQTVKAFDFSGDTRRES